MQNGTRTGMKLSAKELSVLAYLPDDLGWVPMASIDGECVDIESVLDHVPEIVFYSGRQDAVRLSKHGREILREYQDALSVW